MLYFLFWLAVTISNAVESIHFKYLIFLTHWGFIAWNSYLVLSTVTVTLALFLDKCRPSPHSRIDEQVSKYPDEWEDSIELGCCGARGPHAKPGPPVDCGNSREGNSCREGKDLKSSVDVTSD